MSDYELMFILQPNLDETKLNEIIDKTQSVITTNGGTISKVQNMGKKALSVKYGNCDQGIYVLINYQGQNQVNTALNEYFKITEQAVRHLVLSMSNKAAQTERQALKRAPRAKKAKPVEVMEKVE